MATWSEGAVNIRSIGQKILEGIADGIEAASYQYQADIRQRMADSPRGGQWYRVAKNTWHKASAPGEPPAPDTGSLSASIRVLNVDRQRLIGGVGSFAIPYDSSRRPGYSVIYAPYLEYGTKYMAPRPAWRPTAAEIAKRIPAIMLSYVRRRIGG